MKKLTEADLQLININMRQAEDLMVEIKELDIKLAEHEKLHGQDAEYRKMHHDRHMKQSYAFDALAIVRELRGDFDG